MIAIMFETISLIVSVACNLGLLTWIVLKKQKPVVRPESYELSEFLKDLMNGSGLVRVQRISTSDVILRSPRPR